MRTRTKLLCEYCKKEYYPKGGHLKQKFCSRKCKGKYQSENGTLKKGRKYPHLQRARIGICLVCGKKFRAIKDYKEKKQKYCSKGCWSKRATIIKKCKYCNKNIKTSKSINKKYCNNKCRDMDYRERLKGKNAPAWKGGKTKESKCMRTRKAYRVWRESVFKRDDWTCQRGGAKGVYLEAHHIKEISKFPELIYDVDNGETLCLGCHQKEHPNTKLNRKRKIKGV